MAGGAERGGCVKASWPHFAQVFLAPPCRNHIPAVGIADHKWPCALLGGFERDVPEVRQTLACFLRRHRPRWSGQYTVDRLVGPGGAGPQL